MSQRLATKTAHPPDKKSANIDKIIGLSNSCIVIKFIKIFSETFFPKKFCPYLCKTGIHLSGAYKEFCYLRINGSATKK